MKFPEHWLREWVDHGLAPGELAERLTMAGHEIDEVTTEGASLDDILVAEVLDVARHPDADRLSVCRVRAGAAEHRVVCGAPNVEAGMKSALALPGTELPGGTTLERAKIRGVESDGMLCSPAELGLGDDADGILRLPDDAPAGGPLADYLQLPDTVFDVDLTPNRGDCFSVLGIARELSALTGAELKRPDVTPVPPAIDDVQALRLEDPEACPRFAGRVIRGIDPGARSPLWLTERLRRSGIRPIHPVVDVTNYVMLELGQPMHAYDLARLSGAIRPRFATAGEEVTLLDERRVEVDPDTVVISDDSGVIGLGGIMGGLDTAVTGTTTDVYFEAAWWPREIMVGRARRYALHTDASLRFERGVDPEGQARAIERATALLLGIAGGRAGPVDDAVHRDRLPRREAIELRRSRLLQVLGVEPPGAEVAAILGRLGLGIGATAAGWRVQPPSFRFDLEIEDDLIEEVARIYGYDRIPEATAVGPLPLGPLSERRVDPERLAGTLVARDYREAVTYSFIDAETDRLFTGKATPLVLSNPLSAEMTVMRGSLWPGLLRAAAANLAHQQERVRLFEIGTTFHGTLEEPVEVPRLAGVVLGPAVAEQWGSEAREVDFFDMKADVEALLDLTGEGEAFAFLEAGHPVLQPGQAAGIRRQAAQAGFAGKLHPSVARQLDIMQPVYVFELDLASAFAARVPEARPVSRFPAIRRDIAVVVDEEIRAADLMRVAAKAAPDMIRRVVIFDIYRGPGIEAGRKSVALGLILQETSRTLTDHDADSAMAAAVAGLQREFAAVLRD